MAVQVEKEPKPNVWSIVVKKGYIATLKNGVGEISNPSRRVVPIVEMNQNMLFPLKIKVVQSCLVAKVKDPSWL
ncbi:hypothetical protein PVK06_001891 [Gossypium arboreum]|uniref:Uncharacterized protein n=1 Tax=Gossypium arboreum TaxID=29729 RepID=A0ABR0R268_GOSAR|nr:hypothetical protein PVK06_001891 [Gossypium arboreum]